MFVRVLWICMCLVCFNCLVEKKPFNVLNVTHFLRQRNVRFIVNVIFVILSCNMKSIQESYITFFVPR